MLSTTVSKPSCDQRFDYLSNQLVPADSEEFLCFRIGSNDSSLLTDHQQGIGGRCKEGVTVLVRPRRCVASISGKGAHAATSLRVPFSTQSSNKTKQV